MPERSLVVYRDYVIMPSLYGPNGSMQYEHKDYDGAPEYSYGPPADNRCGVANSIEESKRDIDFLEGDDA